MPRNRLLILLLVTFVVAFGAGLVLRPLIMSPSKTTVANSRPQQAMGPSEPRGTQYFEANMFEARQVVAKCRDGTVIGEECKNAETAIITVESKKRFKRFRSER